MAEVRFVVVGVQRTGTTLIRTCLDSHPAIRCVGEAFKLSLLRGSYAGPEGYHAYRAASLKRYLRHWIDRSSLVQNYLDELYGMSDHRAVGFKFMLSQRQPFPTVVPYLIGHGVRVIHVVRENVLKTLVSRLVARQRKRYHAKESVPVTRIVLPCSDLVDQLQQISDQQQIWTSIFKDRVPYLRLAYESFLSNRRRETDALLQFLEVGFAELQTSLVKVNPDSLDTVLSNYDEVRSRLRGSPWAWMAE